MSKKYKAYFALGLFVVVLLVISVGFPNGIDWWPLWIGLLPFAIWVSIAALDYDKERRGEE